MASPERQQKKKVEAPPAPGGRWRHRAEVAGSIFTALMVIAAILPAYWSYVCRSSGQFCEGSFVAPPASNELLDEVVAKLSTDEGKKAFKGLALREAGFWPFSQRIDVVATFTDGYETAIDSFPAGAGQVDAYNAQREDFAALVRQLSNHQTQIVAYFPKINLARRVFDITPSGLAYPLSVKNIFYIPDKREIVFDLLTDFRAVTVNSNSGNKLFLRETVAGEGPYGETVALSLGSTLHVEEFYSLNQRQSSRELVKESDAKFKVCQDEIESQKEKVDGELFVCQRYDPEDDDWKLIISEWSAGKLAVVLNEKCSGDWSKDPTGKRIFVVCRYDSQFWRAGIKARGFYLEIISRPFGDNRRHHVKGECEELWMSKVKGEGAGKDLMFELATNCSTISVDDRMFPVVRPSKKSSDLLREIFRLTFDENGLPIALEQITKFSIQTDISTK